MAVESGFVAVFLLEGGPHLTKDVATFSPATGFLIFAGILALLTALSTGEAS